MSSHDPFRYLKHKLWRKEGLKVKLPIWLSTTKSQESLQFTCVQVACYNFTSNLISIESLHKTYGLPKFCESQFWKFRNSQLKSPKTKWHLGVFPMDMHKEYYKGEGGGFLQFWVMLNLVSLCLHVVRPCTKSAPIMHYQFIIWLSRSMWIIELFVAHPSPSRSSNMPLYPRNVTN